MKRATQLCLLTALGMSSGCNYYISDGEKDDSKTPPAQEESYRVVADVLMSPIRDVDLLFVIDNSGSMLDEQVSLAAWSEDSLFGVLKTQNLENFDLHVAVVSTDLGAGPYGIGGCQGNGDNGLMQNQQRISGCPTPSDRYISNIAGPDGTRIANHEGSVAEAFACIAQLGTSGCGYEQTLESMKRALDGSNSNNAGFLRDDALLAVIIVSDEDDCSAIDTFLYDSSPSNELVLGPLASFRCFEHGVVCDPDDPREIGVQSDCRTREDSEYMASIAGYGDFLRGLKADPSLLVVGGITGPTNYVSVILDDSWEPELESACANSSVAGIDATPAVRLQEFFAQFPARNTVASICNESMERPLSEVAHRITATANQSPCLLGVLEDLESDEPGLQLDCQVTKVLGDEVTELAACEPSGGAPCYQISRDLESCPNTFSGLAVNVEQTSPPVAGAHIVVRCR